MSRIALKICVEDSRLTFKESFESSATVATLLDCIFSKSGRNSVLLYCGFPPTEIAFSSPHDTLFDVGICSGSVVIVRDRPVVVKRSVAADNSCLFHALSYAVTKDRNQNSTQYREVVSDIISRDTDKYSEAFLGRPNAEYCTWIRQGTSWGGEIERKIIAYCLIYW